MKMLEYTNAVKLLESWIDVAIIGTKYKVVDNAPNTYRSMVRSRHAEGLFLINGDANETSIYSSNSYNIKFRALHDSMHFFEGLTFSFKDEKILSNKTEESFYVWAIMTGQDDTVIKNTCKVIHAEITGQIEYYEKNDKFLDDQLTYILDYLEVA